MWGWWMCSRLVKHSLNLSVLRLVTRRKSIPVEIRHSYFQNSQLYASCQGTKPDFTEVVDVHSPNDNFVFWMWIFFSPQNFYAVLEQAHTHKNTLNASSNKHPYSSNATIVMHPWFVYSCVSLGIENGANLAWPCSFFFESHCGECALRAL